jgi:hypothetical protein
MTRSEQSFGPFKVREANPKTLLPKNTVIHVQLSENELAMLDEGGQKLGSWPREESRVEVQSDFYGCLRLAKASVWVNTGDGSPLNDLSEALDPASPPGTMGRSWVVPVMIVIARVALVGSVGLAALVVGATVLASFRNEVPTQGGWGSQSGWALAAAIVVLGWLLPIAGGSWLLLHTLKSRRPPTPPQDQAVGQADKVDEQE